jgi:hypothetical protein
LAKSALIISVFPNTLRFFSRFRSAIEPSINSDSGTAKSAAAVYRLTGSAGYLRGQYGVVIAGMKKPATIPPTGVGVSGMKDAFAERAGSSAMIAQSEVMIARQRVLISRLQMLGKPTAAAERMLTQLESNLRLMHKIHQFIRVGQPQSLHAD